MPAYAKISLPFANSYPIVQRTKTTTGAILTEQHKKSSVAALTLAAIGIVYGDIGTSPLYTLKTIFDPEHGLALSEFNLQGIISLIFWGLTMIVSGTMYCSSPGAATSRPSIAPSTEMAGVMTLSP